MRKFLASILAITMLVSMLPVSTIAATVDFTLNGDNSSCDYYNIIEKNDYNLAPGAVESEIILNDDTGTNRNVVHVIEVDPTNSNISVMPSFKNISSDVDYTDESNWGSQEMSKQAAHVEKDLGLNVVGAMNVSLSWDFSHPYGLLVYEGKVLYDCREHCEACNGKLAEGGKAKGHPGGGYLVIYKDGTAEIRDPMEPLTGDEWMAQTVCFSFLVKDGVNKSSTEDHKDANRAPRSVLGVKADGSLVIMMNDGRMAPYSSGFTNHEMAETMIALGCVDAINCDGGGSSTFITEREGTGELSVKSRFSDGAERQTLTGILVVSKAVADGKFDHASIETKNALVTPGSTVEFKATGADSAGGPADIPNDVTWQLKDDSMGTISDGVFVSNGKVGTVVAQMVYDGKVVGEDSVEVVIPDTIEFVQTNITAPYTKSVKLEIIAKYGYSEVALKDGDVIFELSNKSIGTINGQTLTATDDTSITEGGTVTATLVHDEKITAFANITLGRASEVVYDFESGADSIANWSLSYKSPYTPDKYYFNDEISVADAATGKVKNGNYALKVTADGDSITCMNWCQTRIDGLGIDLTDAVSLSFWVYIPEGSYGYEWDFGNAIPVVLGHEFQYGTGWQYLTVNVSDIGSNVTKLDQIKLYHSDTNNGSNGYNHYEHPNYYTDVVYYVDDITVNYSTAVEDYQAPVISNATISYEGIDTAVAINGQTIKSNVVAVTANAKDNMEKSNYTGLNTSTAVVYVDGVEIKASCNDSGLISTGDMTLTNGTHIFRFEISDNNGNTAYIEKNIVIDGAEDKDSIIYAPADPTLKDVPVGSLVWMDLTAPAIEKVSSVTAVVDLDNNNTWELDHMVLPKGFTSTYTIDDENNDATITITRTGNNTMTGEAVLASLPIRVWEPAYPRSENEDTYSYRLISVMTYVQMGQITETDGTTNTFASEKHTISTEYNSTRLTSTTKKSSWHEHSAEALEDVDATCTTEGYTGRTFCEDCNSIVDWGTSIEAKGHEYKVVEDKLVCDCGEQLITSGLIELDGKYYYSIAGNLANGWQQIGTDWYYFDGNYVGEDGEATVYVNGVYVPYTFENGKLIDGTWMTDETGKKYYYGPRHYVMTFADVDGDTYYFDANGYMVTGMQSIALSTGDPSPYEFDENGKYIGPATGTGLVYTATDIFYLIDGVVQRNLGLIEITEGDETFYIYVRTRGQLAVGEYTVWINNGIVPYASVQNFDEKGHMVVDNEADEIVSENGVLYYYKDGVKQVNLGLIEVTIDGKTQYIYVRTAGQLAVGEYTVWINNGIVPYASVQTFDENGYMVSEETKNGIVSENGNLYYYVDGVKQVNLGLIKISVDGETQYIYVRTAGQLAVGEYTVWINNGIVPYASVQNFDENGYMVTQQVKDGIVSENGALYYYVDGIKQVNLGLTKITVDGKTQYIYVRTAGQLAVGEYTVWINNGIVPYASVQSFDENGYLVSELTSKNGIYDEDGSLYYYVDGVKQVNLGLVEIEDNGVKCYIYVRTAGQLAVGKYTVWINNGIVPYASVQTFDENGHMK